MTRVPILGYHNISLEPCGSRIRNLHVTPSQFERQMWALKNLGFNGVSMSEGLDLIHGKRSGRSVILTFDDGYLDNLTEAAPILKSFGFSATCYLVSDLVGKHNAWDAERVGATKPLMDVDHVRHWLNAGLEIGSHSRTHPNLTALTDENILDEIAQSRDSLSAMLSIPVSHFCYPYGRHNERTVSLVKRVGYRSAVTQRRGFATRNGDLHSLPRISILGGQNLLAFAVKILTPYEDIRGRQKAFGKQFDTATGAHELFTE